MQWTSFSGDGKKQIPCGDDNKKAKATTKIRDVVAASAMIGWF
jgi:hypothetical protein